MLWNSGSCGPWGPLRSDRYFTAATHIHPEDGRCVSIQAAGRKPTDCGAHTETGSPEAACSPGLRGQGVGRALLPRRVLPASYCSCSLPAPLGPWTHPSSCVAVTPTSSHHCLVCVHLSGHISPFCKDTGHIGIGQLEYCNHSKLIASVKTRSPNKATVQRAGVRASARLVAASSSGQPAALLMDFSPTQMIQ